MSECPTSALAMYVWLKRVPTWRMYRPKRAEQRNLAPGEPGREHETVEGVVLDPPVDHGEERLLEEAERGGIDDRARRRVQAEPFHPARVGSARRDLVGVLVVDDHPQVRQARQHFGQRRLLADAVELEVEVVGADREPRRERLAGADPFELGEVGERFRGVEVVSIRGRERVGPDPELVESGLLTPGRDQRVAEVVDPRSGGGSHRPFQRRLVDFGGVGAFEMQHEVEPGQRRFGETRVPLVLVRSVGLHEAARDALAHLRRVAVAGMKTRHDTNRPNGSRCTNKRTRRRSCRRRIPIVVPNKWSTSIWNRSSRG